MDSYFTLLVNRLTLDDIEVLNTLIKHESTNRFSARTKKEILEMSELSEARFRKTISRLDANYFIDICTGNKDHLLYITEYGIQAIQYIYERVEHDVL